MKLDRLLSRFHGMGRKQARRCVLERRVTVDGVTAGRHDLELTRFSRVELDGRPVVEVPPRIGLMLYKPRGVLSATKDGRWPTVLDGIDFEGKESLHLVGRLDRSTTGLVLLTNDGTWSKALMRPERKVPKVYQVETAYPIAPGTLEAFARGFHFHTENITTLPAELEITGERRARLTLHEGRYHQIKRMFHRVGNRVTALHRTRIGNLALPDDWEPGHWRLLTEVEMRLALE